MPRKLIHVYPYLNVISHALKYVIKDVLFSFAKKSACHSSSGECL